MANMILFLLFHTAIICQIFLIISIGVFSICYHSVVKPDYRPGMNTIPFLWYPLVSSIHKRSKKKLALVTSNTLEALSGLCKLNEKQKMCSLNLLGRNHVLLFTADTAEVILSSNKFTEKSIHYKGWKPMLKDGLIVSNGSKWLSRRKLLTPTFHFKILQDFIPLVREVSKNVLLKLEPSSDQSWVNIMPIMNIFATEIFTKAALGVELDIETTDGKACFIALKKFFLYESFRMTKPWIELIYKFTPLARKIEKCTKIVDNFLLKLIKEKKKRVLYERHNNINNDKFNNKNEEAEFSKKKKAKAFMDLLLEYHIDDNSLTEEDILEETINFFFAATTTAENAASLIMYCIGLYKDVQKKIHDELDKIFENSDRDITEEDLKSMKYLECVIKEAMRLYPVPMISRTATDNIKVFDCTIPENSIVIIVIHMIHRDPEIYSDPEKFDPSRFYPENCRGRPVYAYVPFSAGARNCIAQKFAFLELKTVIATILRKFNAHSLDGRDMVPRVSPTFPLRMRFSPREFSQC